MHNVIIEIENLTHRFQDGTIGIDGISLTIATGEFLVIAGQNGCGKTTLLRHLNGLLLPTSGSVVVDGIPVSTNAARSRQLVGMVFQNPDSQIVGETVFDDVAFGPENLCLKKDEVSRRVHHALGAVGLTGYKDRQPHSLSGGEKRRLAIAGVLAMEPAVVVFDEPFSSLDYPGTKDVLKQITMIHETGRTIIVATHNLEKVIAHAGRLVLMQNGRVARDGIPHEVVKESEAFGVREPCLSRIGMEVTSWLS